MYRMLIVDDEEIVVRTLRSCFSEYADIETHGAKSALEALDILRGMCFDLVITDIVMPNMDGLRLTEMIREYWPDCHVILLTAHNQFDYIYRAVQNDKVNYLLKIESLGVIEAMVRRILDKIEHERTRELAVHDMHAKISHTQSILQHQLLKKMLSDSGDPPDPDLVAAAKFPLCREDGILPAVIRSGMKQEEAFRLHLRAAVDWMGLQLDKRKLLCMAYYQENDATLLIQRSASVRDFPPEDVDHYALECLRELPERLYSRYTASLTITANEKSVPWKDLPITVKLLRVRLEQFAGENGTIVQNASVAPDPQHASRAWITAQMHAFIEDQYTQDISLSHLSEHLHYNAAYLSKIFKEETGQSVVTAINQLRINRACGLLSNSTLKIGEIAAESGFFSAKYFNQAFRKAIGVSPIAYRHASGQQSKTGPV